MRVCVDSDMTVCFEGHTLSLGAGEVVEGPLARYLAASDCEVTVEEDDTASAPKPKRARKSAPAPEETA